MRLSISWEFPEKSKALACVTAVKEEYRKNDFSPEETYDFRVPVTPDIAWACRERIMLNDKSPFGWRSDAGHVKRMDRRCASWISPEGNAISWAYNGNASALVMRSVTGRCPMFDGAYTVAKTLGYSPKQPVKHKEVCKWLDSLDRKILVYDSNFPEGLGRKWWQWPSDIIPNLTRQQCDVLLASGAAQGFDLQLLRDRIKQIEDQDNLVFRSNISQALRQCNKSE